MRIIEYSAIVHAVRDLCVKAAYELPEDILQALQAALQNEESPQGKTALALCIKNASIARKGMLPICQDTGSAVLFVAVGDTVRISGGTLGDALEEGCRQGYRDGFLRASIVDDPLFTRKNTGDNTPVFIHYDIVAGNSLTVTLLPKGGGSENMSALTMLKPADGVEGVTDFVTSVVCAAGGNPCPPVLVGVGIGGTSDQVSYLAKKALLRNVGSTHTDHRYAQLEKELLVKINACGNGPQGLGGCTTALAVFIEYMPCHIASLPVAVNLNCHAARQATVRL